MNENNLPLISVIIPSYNEEKRITRCLDSVLAQTCKNIEMICVDDNSEDSTFQIICDYAEKYSNITALKNPSKGVSSARNFGVENARGKYLGFVDSDDFIQPQMYEFLLRAAEENQLDMAVCRYEKTESFNKKIFNYNCRECLCDEFISMTDDSFVLENELTVSSVCTKLISRDYFLSCGKFDSYRVGEDTVVNSKLWTESRRIRLVDLPLYCYFTNTESVSYTEAWSEKWFDLIATRFISFDNFKKYISDVPASFYLERGMKLILSYRLSIKGTENENRFKSKLKSLFKKYRKSFLKNSNITKINKLAVIIFYYFPFTYKLYRKKIDNTL